MMDVSIGIARDKAELREVLRVRGIVFIRSQKVPVERERDGLDEAKGVKHLIIRDGERMIGTARMRFIGDKAKFERLAVLEEYRGKGVGKKALEYMIRYAKRKGAKEIVLHSQYYLKDFYKKHGFSPRGKIFMDAGIKHIEMFLE